MKLFSLCIRLVIPDIAIGIEYLLSFIIIKSTTSVDWHNNWQIFRKIAIGSIGVSRQNQSNNLDTLSQFSRGEHQRFMPYLISKSFFACILYS